MAKAPTAPLPIGATIPAGVHWNFNNGVFTEYLDYHLPEAGSYVLEFSTDNVNWSPAGTFTPHGAADVSIDLPQAPTTATAFRMTKQA